MLRAVDHNAIRYSAVRYSAVRYSAAASSPAGLEVNADIADRFDEMASLLEARSAVDFRIRAYRCGATVLRELLLSVVSIYDDSGRHGLGEIAGIGQSLAFAIERYIQSGQIPMLHQLRRDSSVQQSVTAFAAAERFKSSRMRPPTSEKVDCEDARVSSSAAMESEQRPGSGGDMTRRNGSQVAELLAIDAEYRARSAADELQRIAPRQFNPTGEAWLPVLRTHRETRHYTAVFSNTAQAHQLGRTHDWVIIRRADRHDRRQWTVVTARRGPLSGLRIVRGREHECYRFYARHPGQVAAPESDLADGAARQLLLFDCPAEE